MLNFLIVSLLYDCVESCTDMCRTEMIGNHKCEKYCMIPECNYDSQFYSDNKYLAFKESDCFSNCTCDEEKLTNGICDSECNTVQCGYDLGSCGYCNSGCFIEDLNSETCKKECLINTCEYYESYPCSEFCAWGCSLTDLFEGTCKKECLSFECLKYDKTVCHKQTCAPECSYVFLADERCQYTCYNSECEYDWGYCDCSLGCNDTSIECLTNDTFTDPCDVDKCGYKDGKCGFCASGCFEQNLGDGICQSKCNTESCNYDYGDCGCAPNCSYQFDSLTSSYIQTGNSDKCSVNCLVIDCRFGIDFCANETIVKSAVLNFLVNKDKEKTLDMPSCLEKCSSEDILKYLEGKASCESDDECNIKECSYCMGKTNKTFENCLIQSFDECFVCNSTMIEGTCYKDVVECPVGYEDVSKLAKMFGNSLWCLKEAYHYSESNFKEISVDSSVESNGNGTKEFPVKTFYYALATFYSAFTKIFLLNKEIDFFVENSISPLISEKYDPLNINTVYQTYELWIIGNYSSTQKTKVFWKSNLKISPKAKKCFIQNIEFIGRFTMKNDCEQENCYYCPHVVYFDGYYYDTFFMLTEEYYLKYYSKDCSSYSSVNVFYFSNEAYLENVDFVDFRYQYNSLIKSSGKLSLENVNFSKIQAKSDGSIILIDCTDDCIHSSFIYNQGQVFQIGIGYNDFENVTTGSFFKSFNTGYISIVNITFKNNFSFNNLRSPSKSYLIFSKNQLGSLFIKDCEFYTNYVNYLVFIDASSLVYLDYRAEKGISMAYSQQHFLMNNITVTTTYCSKGLIYYSMENIVHNINITNLLIKESVIGEDGILTVINSGDLKESDINEKLELLTDRSAFFYMGFKARYLMLENIIIKDSLTGNHALFIENYPNSIIKNISISNIKDPINQSLGEIFKIINLLAEKDPTNKLYYIETKYEKPELYCNEMVMISNSVNLWIETISISNIYCAVEKVTLGLSIYKNSGEAYINELHLSDILIETKSGAALTVTESNSIYINDLVIKNVTNGDESVVKFDNCNKTVIHLAKINDIISNYAPPFIVSNLGFFSLSQFSFNNITCKFNNGGCLSLITGAKDSSYKIQSGNFNKCTSSYAKGGAVFLDSSMRLFSTLFQMENIQFTNCYSEEGSAVFISNNVKFTDVENSELVGLLVQDNSCKLGGILSDYHNSGNLNIDRMKMINNTRGIYIFYSNENLELRILNSKIYAESSLSSVFYLNSLAQWSSIYFQNVEIFNANLLAIEAYNLKMFLNQVNISQTYQAIYLNNKVICEANSLKVTKTTSKSLNLEKNCVFNCNECEFTQNNDSIISASSNSNFNLNNSQIFSNYLKKGFLIFLSSEDNGISSLTNCKIYSNTLSSGSILYLITSSLTLNNCNIINNEGDSTSIQVIYSYSSKLQLFYTRLQFNSFVDNGALLWAVDGSVIIAENTVFENSKSKYGNVYGTNSKINISNSKFLGNSGGDIYTIESYLYLKNCIFENSKVSRINSGVLGMRYNFKTVIEGSIIKNVFIEEGVQNLAFIYDDSSNQLEILDCYMNGSNNFPIAAYFKESTSVLIKNSVFNGFNSSDFSALTAISNIKGCNLTIENSKITKSRSGKSGGGVFVQNYKLIIENTEISYNIAKESGGGIYFISPECDDCGIYLNGKTEIFNNSCKGDGGAVKWQDYKPFIEDSVLIYNNSASYGADLASTPAKFGLFQDRRLSDSILTTLSGVPPGKKITDGIKVSIYDTYGQVVKTENSITATLLANETEDSVVAVTGITTFRAHNGIIDIKDFILTGVPGSNAYIKLKSDNMQVTNVRNDNSEYSDFVYIKVEFRNCTEGEQIQATACVDCDKGKYTLYASENCLDCPTGGTCTGKNSIIVKNGYWRSSLESDIIYACDVFDACLKGTETNELGNCSTAYSGVLCKTCKIGFSKTANGICTKCPNEKTNILTMIILSIGIIFLSFVLVKTTFTSAFSPKSLHSIYIKILTNYLQLVFIVTQFDLEWPHYVTDFFNMQRSAASISDQVFSLDCYISLKTSSDIENVYYTKLIMIAILPIVITTISFVYWIFHGSLIESYKCLKREVYTTIIVLFFLVYPTIVKFMFSNFSCVEIDKMKSYLNENTSIECWDSKHKWYSFVVVMPSIVIWVVGVPTILLLLMVKNRRRLHLDYNRVVFGFLYNGYKQDRFYWEINIMYRKIILITITVFKISQARVAQALNLIFVLLASIYLQHTFRPYYSTELNNMEMQALNIAAITIYFGLYYLSKSISGSIQILLFMFIIVGNSYFILYWVYYMGKALLDIFIKYFPRFKPLLRRGDAFDEEFYKEEILQEGVYFNRLEGEKAYTFINIERNPIEENFKYKSMEDAYIDAAKRDIEKMKINK